MGISLFDKLKYRIALRCCTSSESFLFITHNEVEAKFVFALLINKCAVPDVFGSFLEVTLDHCYEFGVLIMGDNK